MAAGGRGTGVIQEATSIDQYLALFDQRLQTANEPVWLVGLRRAAFDRFAELGFPTLKEEEWRYTDVRPIADTAFSQPVYDPSGLNDQIVRRRKFDDRGCHRLVFVNGFYSRELSSVGTLPAGVRVKSLAETLDTDSELVGRYLAQQALYHSRPFVALNTALMEDGAFVHISRGAVLEKPVHLHFLSNEAPEPFTTFPRTLIVAEESSQVTIVESYAGLGKGTYFTNAVTEIVAGENAVLDHVKVERESLESFHVASTQISLDRSANFTTNNITLGGAIVRNDVGAYLGGEGIECTLNGLYMAAGKQLLDNHTRLDHAMPHCNSHELYKGILDGQSRTVFSGKIHVHPDAQKTDAKQTNQNLLLSPDAQANTKPQLEIYADDVRCTHGATIGQLSDEALFYLRARGIGKDEARALLTNAFASDVIGRIRVEPLREELERVVLAKLRSAGKE